jgi:hypothetical protein
MNLNDEKKLVRVSSTYLSPLHIVFTLSSKMSLLTTTKKKEPGTNNTIKKKKERERTFLLLRVFFIYRQE